MEPCFYLLCPKIESNFEIAQKVISEIREGNPNHFCASIADAREEKEYLDSLSNLKWKILKFDVTLVEEVE